MGIYAKKFRLTLVIGLALVIGLVATALAGTFEPATVTDQTLTAPLANPVPSTYQPRYISGFGSDDSFTVFFEDRDNGNAISYAQTTSGPTGFPVSAVATDIATTHFLVKAWPINIGGTDYAYRAWGTSNSPTHSFYVSNNLMNWELVSTFTIPNVSPWTSPRPLCPGYVYYGFHDVILLNGTYYAFAESNRGQTLLVRSANGDDVWEAFDSVGGTGATWGPLQLPESGTPSGSFVDLGRDRGYGKVHVRGNDSGFYLAVNTAAVASLAPAALEAAFINPANWTWHDGTTGLPASPILSLTTEHDLRECWVVPNSDPDGDWIIVYDADFGSSDGGKALGYATLSPPLPPPEVVWVDDDYCNGCANDGHTWGYDAFDNIQDGIDAVAGSTVNVAAGTYDESVTVNKPLTLLGAKGNVDPRGGAWTGDISVINPGPGGYGVDIRVSNVTINGFEITGGMYGIYVAPGAGDVSDITITYNDLHTNTKYGCQLIDLVDGAALSGASVSKNYVHHNDRNGLKMVNVTDCVVDSNEFAFNGFGAGPTTPEYKYGILLEDERYNGPIYGPAINNAFVRNTFHDNNLGAINMEVMGNASSSYWSSTEFLEGTVVNYNTFHGDLHVWGINVDNDYQDDGTQDGFGPIAIVDAEYNYWGSPTGPCRQLPNGKWVGKGDRVSGNVDYTPRLPHPAAAESFTIAHFEPLAITDPPRAEVVAYPNPVRDVNTATFQVMGALADQVEEIRVQIFDLSGRLVWEDAALGSELDWHTDSLSGDYLANGIYLYRVQVKIDGNWINQDIGRIAVLR